MAASSSSPRSMFEAIAEDQAAYHTPGSTMMQIPTSLVPAVRKLLAKKVG